MRVREIVYSDLCGNTLYITGKGVRVGIDLKSGYQALWILRKCAEYIKRERAGDIKRERDEAARVAELAAEAMR